MGAKNYDGFCNLEKKKIEFHGTFSVHVCCQKDVLSVLSTANAVRR